VTHFHKLFSPFWLPKGKIISGFAIRLPGQSRVPLLVNHKHYGLEKGQPLLRKETIGASQGIQYYFKETENKGSSHIPDEG
jgi:hypothetical protein